MERFLIDKFSKDLEVVDFHRNFLQNYGFENPTKISYVKMYNFLMSATNFLKDIDPDFLETIGCKMYEDVVSLMNFKKNWEKRRLNYYKYFQEYLNTLPDYRQKLKKANDVKSKMEKLQQIIKSTDAHLKIDPDDKKAKREYVDAVHEYSILKEEYEKIKEELEEREKQLEGRFKNIFERFSSSIIHELEKILNTKLYYFSALVFTHAKNSYLINKFAKRSGVEINMKSMIEYFIRNYEVSGSNIEWVNYLKSILKEIK